MVFLCLYFHSASTFTVLLGDWRSHTRKRYSLCIYLSDSLLLLVVCQTYALFGPTLSDFLLGMPVHLWRPRYQNCVYSAVPRMFYVVQPWSCFFPNCSWSLHLTLNYQLQWLVLIMMHDVSKMCFCALFIFWSNLFIVSTVHGTSAFCTLSKKFLTFVGMPIFIMKTCRVHAFIAYRRTD